MYLKNNFLNQKSKPQKRTATSQHLPHFDPQTTLLQSDIGFRDAPFISMRLV